MSIFSRIKDAIWGRSEEVGTRPELATGTKPVVASTTAAVPGVAPPSVPVTADAVSKPEVDVEAILDAAVKKKGQKLNWRTSIVDLMKALDLDSSLSSRKELAKELGYVENMNNSAKMNLWLHKKVMMKLRENGGKLPSELHGAA